MNKLNIRYLFLLFTLSVGFLFFQACQEEIPFELDEGEDKIAVDASIYEGQAPIVFLTRSVPFFGNTSIEDLQDFFIHDAIITISTDQQTDTLEEKIIDYFGQSLAYYSAGEVVGKRNTKYDLKIEDENTTLTASTHIPNILPIDSIWWKLDTIGSNDSLARVYVELNDPDTLNNFYRYFTQRNYENYFPGLNSVFDDLLFNGQSFPTPVDRGYDQLTEEIDFEIFGYFNKGDAVTVRLTGIDEPSYNFWNTLESNAQGGGPFTGITIVDSNIEGDRGFGVWTGYAIEEASIVCE